jgi:hypothetical protein
MKNLAFPTVLIIASLILAFGIWFCSQNLFIY